MSASTSSAASNYLEQEVLHDSGLGLVARVYERAALEIARARAALEAGDPVARGNAVHRAARCLSHLQCAVNVEEGGDVARNLDRIYGYLQRRLSEAHFHKSDAKFAEVQCHVEQLGGAWREAARREHAPEQAPAAATAATVTP